MKKIVIMGTSEFHMYTQLVPTMFSILSEINFLIYLFTTQPRLFATLRKMPFENIFEKGENAVNGLTVRQIFYVIMNIDSTCKLSVLPFTTQWPLIIPQSRVQRISEKALVLQDECLPKGTRPTLIFTRPFSSQFKVKESQNRVFLPPILVDYWG